MLANKTVTILVRVDVGFVLIPKLLFALLNPVGQGSCFKLLPRLDEPFIINIKNKLEIKGLQIRSAIPYYY